MFNPSRQQVRSFFCETWRKFNAGQALIGAEVNAAEIIAEHPEYHALLVKPDAAMEAEWLPEGGQMNPFLHISLHLAISEQLAIDQPPGIRSIYQQLLAKHAPHPALHCILEALAEQVWELQANQRAFDGNIYLARVREISGL